MANYVLRVARRATIALLFVVALALGAMSGLLFASADDLPTISALDDYSPSTITRLVDMHGEQVADFATERRTVIGYDQISPHLRQAIISAEDKTFEEHFGLSFPRLMVTAFRDVVFGERAGASTLTQQLARNLFAREIGFTVGDKSPERKIREILVALQIEKRYTKREILTFYANHIPWGHGIYGAEAASWFYFGKAARDLSLEEAALLAGIVQAPARQSPYVSVERAVRRRNYALQRMADDGYISQEVAAKAKQQPVVTAGRPGAATFAPFFVEDVRQKLEERYGATRLYQSGLTVHTTLDAGLQREAERGFDAGLRRIDKRRGFRKPPHNVVAEGKTVGEYRHERWSRPIAVGAIVPAVVVAASGPEAPRSVAAGSLLLRVGKYFVEVPKAGYAWTRQTSPDFVKVGDLVEVQITTLDDATAFGTGTFEQRPIIEGALIAIDNQTGQIRAMVGGFDFARSKFNRARQAMRQMGSTIKPIVYSAAIDRGYTPVSIIDDSPVAFPAGPNQPLYSPQNYDRTFEGRITLRHALEQSRNIPTVKVLDAVGPAVVIDYARRFGITSPMQPYLSLGLGAAEASLLEMTSAYTVFPRQGVHMMPYDVTRVLDRQGNVLEENRPVARDAIRADTAFVMTTLLRGAATRGTAAAAAVLEWPVAGKTGTMDDYTDAWFIGFDPEITIGVWIGYDEKRSLGRGETGGTAALPIWIDLMKARIERRGRDPMPDFAVPGNIVFVTVDRATGAPTTGETAISETFIAGTQPVQ